VLRLYSGEVLLLIALALAIFVLPSPWGVVAVGVGATLELAETSLYVWWSKRRHAAVGIESLVGKRGVAIDALWPDGQIRVDGEIWAARCRGGCDPGSPVVIRRIDGLVLEVDPA
jgi:membrane protein implicated in regulation of membrane protease activity